MSEWSKFSSDELAGQFAILNAAALLRAGEWRSVLTPAQAVAEAYALYDVVLERYKERTAEPVKYWVEYCECKYDSKTRHYLSGNTIYCHKCNKQLKPNYRGSLHREDWCHCPLGEKYTWGADGIPYCNSCGLPDKGVGK